MARNYSKNTKDLIKLLITIQREDSASFSSIDQDILNKLIAGEIDDK